MIRNSQIVELQAVPRALATAAVRTRSAAVSTLFTSNSGVGPTLAQDSTALFHSDHGNVATTALGTDATAWAAARAECFEHAEVNSSKSLAVFPRYILVPAELYDAALSIFGYGEGHAHHLRTAGPGPRTSRSPTGPACCSRLDRRHRLGLHGRPAGLSSHPNIIRSKPRWRITSRPRAVHRHRRKPGPHLHQRRNANQGSRLVRRQRQRPARNRQTKRSWLSRRQKPVDRSPPISRLL